MASNVSSLNQLLLPILSGAIIICVVVVCNSQLYTTSSPIYQDQDPFCHNQDPFYQDQDECKFGKYHEYNYRTKFLRRSYFCLSLLSDLWFVNMDLATRRANFVVCISKYRYLKWQSANNRPTKDILWRKVLFVRAYHIYICTETS